MPDQHPASTTDARKRHDEACAPAGATNSPEASPSATDATNGQEGGNRAEVEAIRARLAEHGEIEITQTYNGILGSVLRCRHCGECVGVSPLAALRRHDEGIWLAALDFSRQTTTNVMEALTESGTEIAALTAERDSLAAVVASVRELHVRRPGPVVEHDCLEGDCDHLAESNYAGPYPSPECPRLADAVCAHCADQTDPGDGWEHMIRSAAYWPCATIRALLAKDES